ncbi:axeA1, partial [Symbiodinium sp. CCMP2456]
SGPVWASTGRAEIFWLWFSPARLPVACIVLSWTRLESPLASLPPPSTSGVQVRRRSRQGSALPLALPSRIPRSCRRTVRCCLSQQVGRSMAATWTLSSWTMPVPVLAATQSTAMHGIIMVF